MKRRSFLQAGLGWGLAASNARASSTLTWRTIHFLGLGTNLSITAAHPEATHLDRVLVQARELVAFIESQMSLFRSQSALSQLNQAGVLSRPPAELVEVLKISQQFAKLSHGAFDPTVQPLWELYAQHRLQNSLPTKQDIEQARQQVGWQKLRIQTDKIFFTQPQMSITLNGIAQGYASDRVRALLKQQGVKHALINTGEWSALGQSAAQHDWVLGVADPHDSQALLCRLAMRAGACVATSSDDQMAFSDDRRYHHIFDPHTGFSPPDISSVTVVAPNCTMADALTKVLFVAGYDSALQMAKKWQVAAWVVHKSGQSEMTANLPRV